MYKPPVMSKETQIQSAIATILKDMTQEWELDLEEISPQTKLVEDLSFASVDIIHLVVSIEEHFKQKLGFDELLMQGGRYIDDLSVEEIVTFVAHKLKVKP